MMFHGHPEDLIALRREEIRREIQGDRLVALARREAEGPINRAARPTVVALLIRLRRSVQAQLPRIQHPHGVEGPFEPPEQVESGAKLGRQQVGEA